MSTGVGENTPTVNTEKTAANGRKRIYGGPKSPEDYLYCVELYLRGRRACRLNDDQVRVLKEVRRMLK